MKNALHGGEVKCVCVLCAAPFCLERTTKRHQVRKEGAGGSVQRGVGSLSIGRDHRWLDIVEIIVGKR
jgi:hypothetical protein